jgi:hypothetical protein
MFPSCGLNSKLYLLREHFTEGKIVAEKVSARNVAARSELLFPFLDKTAGFLHAKVFSYYFSDVGILIHTPGGNDVCPGFATYIL